MEQTTGSYTHYVIFYRFFIFRLVFSLLFSCPLPSQLIKFLFLESHACQKHYSISIFLSHVLSLHFVVFSSLHTFYAVTFLFPGLPEKHCLSACTWKLTWISIRWTFDFLFPSLSTLPFSFLFFHNLVLSCYLYMLPYNLHCASGDRNLWYWAISESLPCSYFFWCFGMRSECLAIWVEELHWAEYPGNDQWAVSQLLGDYQCSKWDHKPDGGWWEFELD